MKVMMDQNNLIQFQIIRIKMKNNKIKKNRKIIKIQKSILAQNKIVLKTKNFKTKILLNNINNNE